MGKPYLYTRVFKPILIYDARIWEKLENNLIHLEEVLQSHPIEESPFDEMLWNWPLDSKPQKDLYNIIKLIARVTGTKIMWKWDLMDIDARKALLIVGESTRVILCNHILNYTIEGILKYGDYLKKEERDRSKALGYLTITTYINYKVSKGCHRIINILDHIITTDKVREYRLENYIMGRYKLNYKNYGQTTNAYDNAISEYFHPKRMML